MQPRSAPTSAAEVAGEVGSVAAGLGILTTVLFPFALPLLLLAVAPLIPVAVAGLVLGAPVALAVWLVRAVRARVARWVHARPRTSALRTPMQPH